MVNQVSNVTSTGQTNQVVYLRPPSELYGSDNTNGASNTSNTKETKKIYKEDAVSVPAPARLVSELSQFGVGALSGYKYQQTFIGASDNIGSAIKTGGVKDLLTAFETNGKVLGVAAYNAAGVGAILSGGVSALLNTGTFLAGKDSARGAAANVLTDTIGGAISGVGGLAVGGVSSLALSLFKVSGTPLVIAGVIGGAVGAAVVNKLVNTEGIRHTLRGN